MRRSLGTQRQRYSRHFCGRQEHHLRSGRWPPRGTAPPHDCRRQSLLLHFHTTATMSCCGPACCDAYRMASSAMRRWRTASWWSACWTTCTTPGFTGPTACCTGGHCTAMCTTSTTSGCHARAPACMHLLSRAWSMRLHWLPRVWDVRVFAFKGTGVTGALHSQPILCCKQPRGWAVRGVWCGQVVGACGMESKSAHLRCVSIRPCRSTVPSAFTGYSFHIIEAIIVFANEVCALVPALRSVDAEGGQGCVGGPMEGRAPLTATVS